MRDCKIFFKPELWAGLRSNAGKDNKARRARITSIGDIGIYAIISPVDMLPCVKVEGPLHSGIVESRFPRMSGLSVSVQTNIPQMWDDKTPGDAITIKLTNGDDNMFDALSNDILSVVEGADALSDMENIAIRIAQWQDMLTKPKNKTPTVNEALGLLGELHFLRDFLIPTFGIEVAMQAWLGPLSGKKDFECINTAFEIKSTQDAGVSSLSISSFDQLDEEGFENLYLVLNEFRQEPEAGESLLNVYESLRRILINRPDLVSRLEFLIHGLGWAKGSLLENVANVKFRLDTKSFFKVDGAFPRYTRRDRKPGTMNLRYDIILSDCLAYSVSESTVQLNLKG